MIGKDADLSLENHNLIVDTGEIVRIPLVQLSSVTLESGRCDVSAALLRELINRDISLIICDEKHEPCGSLTGFGTRSSSPGNVIDQAEWPSERKDQVWQQIVIHKIRNQRDLIESLGKGNTFLLDEYLSLVAPGDLHNMEAMAARMYFHQLFGITFNRRTECDINSILNYGYSILRSCISRMIVYHSYSTILGIKHSSRSNPFNLSCDLMEPFRPVVDKIAYENMDATLNNDMRHMLQQVPYKDVFVNGRRYNVVDAAEAYFLSAVKVLAGEAEELCEIKLVG